MDKKTYFLSDLHLGASYLKNPRENERRIVRFLDSIKEDAKTIYLLGDILDYWYEYKTVVPRGNGSHRTRRHGNHRNRRKNIFPVTRR